MKNTSQSTENQELPVSFTVFKSTGILSKRCELDADDNIIKTAAAHMTSGTARRVTMDFSEFGKALADADERTAFGYGLYPDTFGEQVKIVVKGKERESEGIISRSQQYFAYCAGPGIVMNDHDPHPRGQSVMPDELQAILGIILPGFGKAASWTRGSISAGIHRILYRLGRSSLSCCKCTLPSSTVRAGHFQDCGSFATGLPFAVADLEASFRDFERKP